MQGRQHKTFLPRGSSHVPSDLQKPSTHTELAEEQPVLAPKQGELLSVPHWALGAKMAGLPFKSLPGGKRPTEHLTAVLHYVAMAVGILHAVLPSPGPLNLQQAGHKLRSAPPTLAHRALPQPAGHVSKADAAVTHRGSDEKQRWLRGTERLYLHLRWLSDSVPPGRCGTQLTPPLTTG